MGKQIVLDDFDATMMEYCIYEAKLDYKDGKKDSYIQKLDKFSHSKWVAWEEMVYTYFTAMKNSQGVPLTYVTRKTPAPPCIVIDREQEIIQNHPPQGNMFSCDTNKVIEIMKELTVYTDAETCMKERRCGQEAMLALHNYYDEKSEGECR